MNNFLFLLALWAGGIACATPLLAQSTIAPSPPFILETQIDGVVTARKKYSFTVSHDGKQTIVKLADGAPVGLKMNRPWYDWNRHRVVVDAVPFPESSDPGTPKRVAIPLPAKELFLISRFKNIEHMESIMSSDVKRINFYLVTPDDPGEHYPTKEQYFIAGALVVEENQPVKNQPIRLQVNDESLLIRLGFQFATMNGFSIAQLEPNTTHVFLSGVAGENEDEFVASRVLFHPIDLMSLNTEK